jgi:hypothetical protein
MLETQKKITKGEALNLAVWLQKFRKVHPDHQSRIDELVARLQ